jgi:beta-glucanase (GH16 family)
MIKLRSLLAASLLLPAVCTAPGLRADATVGAIAPKALLDPTSKDVSHFTASDQAGSQVTVAPAASGSGVDVTVNPGAAGYPGAALKPASGASWDLTPFGDVTASVTNTSAKSTMIAMRVDHAGDWHDSPWSAENFYFKAGETKQLKVIFGYSFGGKKDNYPFDPSAVVQVLFFTGKVSGAPITFHIDSVEASGSAGEKPPVDPSSVRIAPVNGYILGPGVTVDAAKQISTKGGVTASVSDTAIKADFPAGGHDESVTFKPAAGKWDLRDALELRVKVRNDGQAPVTPSASSKSQGGDTDTIAAAAPLAPGAEAEIVLPFINPRFWQNTPPSINPDPGTGNKYTNNGGVSVTVSVPKPDAASTLTIESIQANRPTWDIASSLGQKPPVDGEWTQTFDEEFKGHSIDESKWNLITENYWDHRTHFTREETTVANGSCTIHYIKKSGPPEIDPTKPATPYACGYLDTYGKWVQRYGYFESKFKMPSAPGLWPAFWLMPDRGVADGPQWKRSDTGTQAGTQGMEFDIFEYLSGWGPCRYNIAMHWDGYGKNHKSTGQTTNYFVPDKDGFVTAGLLWLPGQARYFANGHEVLHYENDRVSNTPSFIIFDCVSGGWDNLPLDDSKLPAEIVIKYIRVWQRKDLASAADGLKTAASPAKAPATASQ